MSDVTRAERAGEAPRSPAGLRAPSRSASPPRLRIGSGLLRILTKLAGAPTRGEGAPVPTPRGRAPNHCEFDYDYYVALRRQRSVGAGLPTGHRTRFQSNPRT